MTKVFNAKKCLEKYTEKQTDKQTERTKEEMISHHRLTTRQGYKKLCDV